MHRVLLPTSAIIAVAAFLAFLGSPLLMVTSVGHEWRSVLLAISVTCFGIFLTCIPERAGIPGTKSIGILAGGIGLLMFLLSVAALFSG